MKLYTFNIENVGVKEVKAINLVEAYNKLEKLVESNLVNYNIIETTVEPFKYKYVINDVYVDAYTDLDYNLIYEKEFYSNEKLTEKNLISLIENDIELEHTGADWFEVEFYIEEIEYEEIEL